MDPISVGVAWNAVSSLLKQSGLFVLAPIVRRLKKGSPFQQIEICLKHRLHAREKYYEQAFSSGQDILYVSIMSQDTIKEMEPHLEKAKAVRSHIRVLTWHAEMPREAIESFHKHLKENASVEQTIAQLRKASESWDDLSSRYGDVLTVRRYRSSPTMQAVIVGNQWALLELLPYGTHKNDRPALVLTSKNAPEVFPFFKKQLEQLWEDAK